MENSVKFYESGVPETELQTLCNDFGIKINIDVPFSNEPYIRVEPDNGKFVRKNFNYLNIKENHVVNNKTYDKFLKIKSDAIMIETQGTVENFPKESFSIRINTCFKKSFFYFNLFSVFFIIVLYVIH